MSWNLVNSTECPAVISDVIGNSTERAVMSAMRMVYDSTTAPILETLLKNASDSPDLAANSLVLPDEYSAYNPEIPEQKEQYADLLQYLERARAIGMMAFVANGISPLVPKAFKGLASQFGRDHRKVYLGDDVVIGFGGCNASGPSFDSYLDFLLKNQDEEVADYVYDLAASKLRPTDDGDRATKIGDDWILTDSGRVNRSIIQDTAEDFLGAATNDSATFVSQYRPFSKLESLLEDNGALCVYNNSTALAGAMRLLDRVRYSPDQEKSRRAIHHPVTYVHAKLLIASIKSDAHRTIYPEGGKVAIFGTNNFNTLGKFVGTQEYALVTKDPQAISQAEAWVETIALAS